MKFCVIFLGILLALFLVIKGQRVVLVVYGTILIKEDIEGKKTIATVTLGKKLNVIGCVDLKHYIVPRVKLDNGVEGFVLDGSYTLEKSSIFNVREIGSISFSCP